MSQTIQQIPICKGQHYIVNRRETERCKNCEICEKYQMYKNGFNSETFVSYKHVADFRTCDKYKERYVFAEEILTMVTYHIIYVNEVAISYLLDIQSSLDKSDNGAVNIYKSIKKRMDKYQKTMFRITGDKTEFYATFCDEMDEYTKPVLDKMRKLIGLILTNNKVMKNNKLIAACEIASILTEYAAKSLEKRVQECWKINKDVVSLRYYSLAELSKITKKLCKRVNKKITESINLNNDKNLIDLYRQYDRIVTDNEIIKQCQNKAIELTDGRAN